MSLKAIIIDDEPKSITSLKWELQNFCEELNILEAFSDPEKALSYLKNNAVDCIFLDIEMPKMDGFQFLEHFPERQFSVIFTTAYDQYAINAIKERALDYLLKPIDSDDLKQTIDKIKAQQKSFDIKKSLEETLLSLSKNNHQSSKKIAISIDGKLIFFKPEEIIYCESDGNYCHIFLENNEKLFVTKKLKEMEEMLPAENFYRVHNSFVVNLNKVREFVKTDGYLVLDNKQKIPVSRNKKSDFLDKI
ncbi:MAG: LytTR family DNA-binding domain-containing protein [Flavobacteriaceae bacterium]